jgi:surface polysaccharide O-acyltransferase-like enzyme
LSDLATPSRAANRDTAIDLLKILAIFGVLTIHACGLLGYGGRTPALSEVHDSFLFVAFANFCIPIFVMCSGAMILSGTRDAPPLLFYQKRLPRILVPLVFWSLVYFVYTEPTWPGLADIPRFLNKLLADKVFGILWFLYMLLGVYLSAPFLQMLLRQAQRSHLWVFVGICLVLASLQRQLTHVLVLKFGLDHSIFTPYIGYFVLGHLLQTAAPVSTRRRLGLAGLYALMALAAFEGQWLLQIHCDKVLYNFLDYTSINVAVASAALFAALRGLRLPVSVSWGRILGLVANATYGIYLVHMLAHALLVRGVLGFSLTPGLYPPLLGVPLTVAGMFVLSLAMVLVLSRIPWLRQTVGYASRARRGAPWTA